MASTGGCDSSDCLFCQYRSNSPFHLNAYAGKLTTLLRKRSANGAALASLNTLLETSSTEQGAALLAAVGGAAAAACGAGGAAKRHRTGSHSGSQMSGPLATAGAAAAAAAAALAAAQANGSLCGGMLEVVSTTAELSMAPAGCASGRTSLEAPSGGVRAHLQLTGVEHDCGTMCEGGCEGHSGRSALQLHATSGSGTEVESVSVPNGIIVMPLANGSAGKLGRQAPAASGARTASAARGDASEVEPGLSSLSLEQHVPDHHLQPSQRQPPLTPNGGGSDGAGCEAGSQFPEGWAFRPEWRGRHDPAPAALQEVLRLSAGGGCSTSSGQGLHGRSGTRRPSHRVSGSGGSAGAGIVCALEFSPDGRLLAAGGVDKQIRLFNLSSFFGEMEEDDELGMLTDATAAAGGGRQAARALQPSPRGARGGGDEARGVQDDEDDGDDDYDDRRIQKARQQAAAARGKAAMADESEEEAGEEGLLAVVQRMPSKVSCISWSPFMDGVMTVGDYDGVLLQLHIASGHQLSDVDAHGGRKIWSVAHSSRSPHLAASAADDRTARLWAGRGLATCVATLQPNPRASVCCVDFSPAHDHMLALACSDRVSYLYDMRRLAGGPLAALRHHARPASYCRFLGGDRLVTAATDASLAVWDLRHAVPQLVAEMGSQAAAAGVDAAAWDASDAWDPLADGSHGGRDSPFHTAQAVPAGMAAADGVCVGAGTARSCTEPSRVFRGHRNEKNFVGLSVRWPDGLVACGSECSRAFAYHTSWADPLATLDLARSAGGGLSACLPQQPVVSSWASGRRESVGVGLPSGSGGVGGSGFVSAVCWQPAEAADALGLPPLLASASSCGAVSLSVLAARGV
ncbi:hypothetical protein HXX76_014340 [Chlamydomonas incerta]|uniref:Uncharacterized protein n=1 Tax=Chlamydomonas incerta TaxID=51695 RepID=A0A835VR30_CHLIN|nr:hypothetical protein HXX76_014340 [Chlamydomonas incerta]|eukprot:KAG2424615.1 hypothetical protein HXX76_014340 [Chlamydomonas incerta]